MIYALFLLPIYVNTRLIGNFLRSSFALVPLSLAFVLFESEQASLVDIFKRIVQTCVYLSRPDEPLSYELISKHPISDYAFDCWIRIVETLYELTAPSESKLTPKKVNVNLVSCISRYLCCVASFCVYCSC